MWVSKQSLELIAAFQKDLEDRLRTEKTDRETERMQHREQLRQSAARYNVLNEENKALRERMLTMVGDQRAAQVEAQLLRIRVNQLQEERDQLLTKILPDLRISTPQMVSQQVVTGPGVDFNDVGDDRAREEGLGPEQVVDFTQVNRVPDDDLDGMTGTVLGPGTAGQP